MNNSDFFQYKIELYERRGGKTFKMLNVNSLLMAFFNRERNCFGKGAQENASILYPTVLHSTDSVQYHSPFGT